MLIVTLIYLWFAGIAEGQDCTNLAAGKPTGYNTVAGLHGVSGGTANGITDGHGYQDGGWSDCVHTNDWRTDPFVYVDLGDVYEIEKVIIEAGPAGTLGWSGNMKIVVSDSILETVQDFAEATVCATVPSGGFTTEYGEDEFFCDQPINGRYVGYIVEGVASGSCCIVMFCETKVFATECVNPQPVVPDQCLTLECNSNDLCIIDSCDTELGCQQEAKPCPSHLVCVDGECQRDCDEFNIDGFLTECSTQFEGNGNNIATLQGNVNTINGRLADIEADIFVEGTDATVSSSIAEIKSKISGIEDTLESYRAAHSEGSIANILNNGDDSEKLSPNSFILTNNSKDALIIFLLIFNILTMIGGFTACTLRTKSKMSKHSKYDNVNQYSSADENQQLQS